MSRFNLLWWVIPALLLNVLLYSNCDSVKFNKDSNDITSQSLAIGDTLGTDSNGEGYGGKFDIHAYWDRKSPCVQLDNEGEPFPNQQIMIIDGDYHLVRNNCTDIEPVVINREDISVDPLTGQLSFMGRPFEIVTNLEKYKPTQLQCPEGLVVTNQQPTNLFTEAYDFQASVWDSHDLAKKLVGSFSMLPLYELSHDTNSLKLPFESAQATVLYEPETQYMVSFLVKPGTLNEYRIMLYESDTEGGWSVIFNLETKTIEEVWNYRNMGYRTTSTFEPYGDGYLLRTFFRTALDINNNGAKVGIAPAKEGNYQPQLGDSIRVSNATLYKVDSYCSPVN